VRLRLFALCALLLSAFVGAAAAQASASVPAAVCNGDYCTISTPFDGLRADIGTNAPLRLVRLYTVEASLAQAFHPPGPCTPGSCVPSQVVLIALDLQIRALPTLGCPGGCSFTALNAYVLDRDVRGILADAAVYPTGLRLIPPGPPLIPPGPPGVPGPS
jgi:hypothetical protein